MEKTPCLTCVGKANSRVVSVASFAKTLLVLLCLHLISLTASAAINPKVEIVYNDVVNKKITVRGNLPSGYTIGKWYVLEGINFRGINGPNRVAGPYDFTGQSITIDYSRFNDGVHYIYLGIPPYYDPCAYVSFVVGGNSQPATEPFTFHYSNLRNSAYTVYYTLPSATTSIRFEVYNVNTGAKVSSQTVSAYYYSKEYTTPVITKSGTYVLKSTAILPNGYTVAGNDHKFTIK